MRVVFNGKVHAILHELDVAMDCFLRDFDFLRQFPPVRIIARADSLEDSVNAMKRGAIQVAVCSQTFLGHGTVDGPPLLLMSSHKMNINQHVVRRENGWAVVGEGNQRDTVVLPTQRAAVIKAREIARNQGSELIIHNDTIHVRREQQTSLCRRGVHGATASSPC